MGYDHPKIAFVTEVHMHWTTPELTLSGSTAFHIGSKNVPTNPGEHLGY